MNANTLLADPTAIEIERFVSDNDSILIVVRTIQPAACCPQCNTPSSSLKTRYIRRLADLPWHNVAVRLELNVRKFRCRNRLCSQKVFCERLPEVVAPFARRTVRLAKIVELLAFALGARAAAKTTTKLQFAVGKDVFLRAMRRAAAARKTTDGGTVSILGVDDFAFRRGHTYGTILVDLVSRQPIDLLPDRTAQTLEKWLRAHPEVKVVSRDRSHTYAEAAAIGAPAAEQVADRFHLVKNIGDAFERILHRSRLAIVQTTQTMRCREQPEIVGAPAAGNKIYREKCLQPPQDLTGNRATRVERYEAVKRLRGEGCSINEISRQLRMHRETVRHFLAADLFPERAPAFRRASPLTCFDAFLQQRWNDGCANARQLYREIKKQGYTGCYATVRRYLLRWREALPIENRESRLLPVFKTPAARCVKWWLLKRHEDAKRELPEKEAEFCRELLAQNAEIKQGLELVTEFRRILANGSEADFERWQEKVRQSTGLKELKNFAANLKTDERAVRAAVTSSWSNGQTEGQVNRLKTIKRQMYGRAKFDLLRARVLHQD